MKTHNLLLKSILAGTLLFICAINIYAQKPGKTDAIYSGVHWFDQNKNPVSAHGANIIQVNKKFYLFGEIHSDTSNAFAGFSCYSSTDLYNWKSESIALTLQQAGKLGPNRVGERPKVMKIPETGEFIMFMHVDSINYKDQFVGYAISKKVTGPYQFKGPLLFNGKPIKKWDMGTFQDTDGSGYILTHGGLIYRLSDDYQSVVAETNKQITSGFESPTLFKRNGTYYFIGSNLTSWEKNDNYYYTSKSISGPWVAKGLIAPKETLTWNSQSTFVLPVTGSKDTTFIFMGDRWSFPKQKSAATYVWQPITFNKDEISLPFYLPAWTINLKTGTHQAKTITDKTIDAQSDSVKYKGNWHHQFKVNNLFTNRTADTAASSTITFKGRQIAIIASMLPDNGYAIAELTDQSGKLITRNYIDMYSAFTTTDLVYLSPLLPVGYYQLKISPAGERPNWTDKSKKIYGSKGNFISLNQLIIKE